MRKRASYGHQEIERKLLLVRKLKWALLGIVVSKDVSKSRRVVETTEKQARRTRPKLGKLGKLGKLAI